jgi:hypothetical protein
LEAYRPEPPKKLAHIAPDMAEAGGDATLGAWPRSPNASMAAIVDSGSDEAGPAHVRNGNRSEEHARATSAPGPGAPLPHLHQDFGSSSAAAFSTVQVPLSHPPSLCSRATRSGTFACAVRLTRVRYDSHTRGACAGTLARWHATMRHAHR